MRSITTATTLAMILAFGGMAAAQETQAEPEETLPTLDDLSIGEPVGPQIGQPYVLQEFGDWQMRCVKQAEGNVSRATCINCWKMTRASRWPNSTSSVCPKGPARLQGQPLSYRSKPSFPNS